MREWGLNSVCVGGGRREERGLFNCPSQSKKISKTKSERNRFSINIVFVDRK